VRKKNLRRKKAYPVASKAEEAQVFRVNENVKKMEKKLVLEVRSYYYIHRCVRREKLRLIEEQGPGISRLGN